jgi:hypothetical protein
MRVTESIATPWPLSTAEQVVQAWEQANRREDASRHAAADLTALHERIREAATTLGAALPAREAIGGQRSANDTRAILEEALEAQGRAESDGYCWCYVLDFTDSTVVYRREGHTWQRAYAIAPEGTVGTVTFPDEPVEVTAQTWYVPAATGVPSIPASAPESVAPERAAETVTETAQVDGRLLEAKGQDDAGGRVYRVRIIQAGESKNGRIYPASVLEAAAGLYEGSKAFDHHRTPEEMASGTIRGLVGWYSDVAAVAGALEADLHLLPSATHAAEALDAALAEQADGREPLIGLSHDVQATFRRVDTGAGRRMEATAIVSVNSADLVSHPAAGGKATRAVASEGGELADETATTEHPPGNPDGSTDDPAPQDPAAPPAPTTQESAMTVETTAVLAALQTASDEQLAAAGLARAKPATETTTPAAVTETAMPKTSYLARMMVQAKVTDAGLPAKVAESLTEALPDQVTEADVDAQISSLKAALGVAERADLVPAAPAVVTQEATDKKRAALDAFFAGDYRNGYRSFREAFGDFTGHRPRGWDEDLNRTILRESIGGHYDSSARSTESLDSTSWAQALGDSITRRLVAEYSRPNLQTWRQIVSAMPPVNDFRTQRIARVGGYGTLPTVGQAQPYQPLTSPGDEEATYALVKKGGTEDLTLEMIANDDVRAISGIPRKLGMAAAQTLYRFVFDMLATNVTCTYDSVALFHASHNNTASSAPLSQTTLSAGRVAMRSQSAYGDNADILGLTPKILVVPNELEEISFQLSRSAVAIPSTPAGPSDTPNLHSGIETVVVDYWTDANDWFLLADPATAPTCEIGFYQGREEPELFTQSDPNVGSAFNSDSLTFKIRHIYSGAWLDHRSAYRGVG